MTNRQFYTYKFKSSRLKEFNYNINITFDEAKEFKEVIALADNQILRSIRDIRKRTVNYSKLEIIFKERDIRKKISPPSQENSERIEWLQNKINRTMFISDYITIVMEHPSHYKKIFNQGIIINGKKFKRLSCSAGQARVSTVVFCCEEILEQLNKRLNNGRDINKKIAPSKFNAYFGLYSSATHLVSTPKFIVVRDFVNKDKFKVNFVTEEAGNTDDKIDIRDIELEMNRTDGMGLISPSQAELWANELGLDWTPSQFCIRQSFLKGMLCVFDIHNFCKKINNNSYIVDTIYKDEFGEYIKADLRDYEVIITESQFKLWDSFSNLDEYINNCNENKLYWGISQYTPRQPKNILKLNYQFIQTLDLKKNDIEKLSKQFVEWICGVSYDNTYYMLLFLLGINNNEYSIKKYLKNSNNYWIKSLILNPELKNDKYIRTKIRELIKIRIQKGCMGDIFVDGNFQVLVYDPYAFMQHVCGLDVTGLLNKEEYYSNYWNERDVTQVDAMRSPLTYRSEHVILNLKKDDDTEEWYKYCKEGIILNYYGHEVVNFGGADVDYDILATTSNPEIIKGVYKDEFPVVYDPPTPKKLIFSENDLYNSDTFSFGSIIGSITNKSSNAYSLLPNIEKEFGKDSEEYKITVSRLKQCCKAQSAQIDKAKIGREVKGIPKLWIYKQKIKDDDSEDVKKTKELYNNILLNKYPYFFKYLYKDAKRKFNKYYEENGFTCKQKFGIPLSELIKTSKKTLKQERFLKNYYKYMPLTYSDNPMNLLCEYLEGINFNINKKIKAISIDVVGNYINEDYPYTSEQYNKIIDTLKKHMKKVRIEKNTSENNFRFKFASETKNRYFVDNSLLEKAINQACSNVHIVVNVLLDYFYKENPNSNKDILWSTYGKYIYKNIVKNKCNKIMFPFPDVEGSLEYLGQTYSLKEIKINEMEI